MPWTYRREAASLTASPERCDEHHTTRPRSLVTGASRRSSRDRQHTNQTRACQDSGWSHVCVAERQSMRTNLAKADPLLALRDRHKALCSNEGAIR